MPATPAMNVVTWARSLTSAWSECGCVTSFLLTYGNAQQFVSVGWAGSASLHWCQLGLVASTSMPFFFAYALPSSTQDAGQVAGLVAILMLWDIASAAASAATWMLRLCTRM